MTTELTKAAQQALEACPEHSDGRHREDFDGTCIGCGAVMNPNNPHQSALTQRPAAQTERATPEPVAVSLDACAEALFESDKSMWMSGPTFSDLHERDKERCRVMARAVMMCDARGLEFAGWSGVNPRSGSVEMCAHTPSPSVIRDFNMRPVFFGGAIKLDAEATPEPVGEPFGWLFQHEETGRVQVVDSQQVEWGFETNNQRWQKIRPVYTHPAPCVPDAEDLRDRLVAISSAVADRDDRAAQSMLSETLRLLAAAQAKGAGHA